MPSDVFVVGFGLVAEPPGCRTAQVGGEVFSAVFEFVTNESDAIKVRSHCELFIINLGFL